MNRSVKTGFSFGLTSGVITTLGLMVGLHSGTRSTLAVMGGILTIAVADAFSDALGIHLAEESRIQHGHKEIWEATISTFLSKFLVAMTFAIPVFLLSLTTAIVVSIVWGIVLLAGLSVHLARQQRIAPWKVVTEHLVIASVVIIVTHLVGMWIRAALG
ncbi:MAG: hypothetical protein C4293_05420 [Nitrospiraceae bacterium]